MRQFLAIALLLAFSSTAFAHPTGPASSPREIARLVVSAIDEHYLYAESNPAWKNLRERILAAQSSDRNSAFAFINSELVKLRDSELHLVSPAEGAAIDREGKGASLGTGLIDFAIDLVPETGQARVVTPSVGSPAARAGIRPHDVIVSINGKTTSSLDHEQVADALRERSADLTLKRDARTLHVHLERSDAPLRAVVAHSESARGSQIAYIRIAQFTPDSGDAIREQVQKLEAGHLRGYVLDLRNNPGGFLTAAASAVRVFTPGALGAKVRRNGDVEPITNDAAPLTSKPVVLLVNAGTASAAEFFAGVLQDQKRAKLIGVTTYGRGQAQVYVPLLDGYGIVVPSALLRTPSGRLFKGKGLEPDLTVISPPVAEADLASARDTQFQRAVAVLLEPRA